MPEDLGLIKTYRNRVMGIAAGVMVYAIAGGSVSTVEKDSLAEVTLFGVKLWFSRPDWLVCATVMLLIYFWWRHSQLILPFRKDFATKVYKNIIFPHKLMGKVNLGVEGNDDILQSEYEYGVEVKRRDVTREDYEDGKDYIIKVKPIGFLKYEINLFEISSWQLDYHLERGEVSSQMTCSKTKRFETKELCDRLSLSYLYWKSFISLAIKKTDFTDAFLPDIITAIAIITFSFNKLLQFL